MGISGLIYISRLSSFVPARTRLSALEQNLQFLHLGWIHQEAALTAKQVDGSVATSQKIHQPAEPLQSSLLGLQPPRNRRSPRSILAPPFTLGSTEPFRLQRPRQPPRRHISPTFNSIARSENGMLYQTYKQRTPVLWNHSRERR